MEGVEILDELGWESVCTPLGGPTGVCVPRNLSSLVGVRVFLKGSILQSLIDIACYRRLRGNYKTKASSDRISLHQIMLSKGMSSPLLQISVIIS